MILAKFRQRYPQGSLVSELVEIDRGLYIVKVSVQVGNIILATALAGADRVETAEDAARERAIAALILDTEQKVMVDNSPSVVNGGVTPNTSGKTESAMMSQETIKIKKDNTPSQTSMVNFSEQQIEVSSQASTSTLDIPPSDIPVSEAMASTSIPEYSVTQPIISEVNESVPMETPPTENPGKLFEGTFASETSENSLVEENIIVSTSSPTDDSITDPGEIELIDFNEIKQKTDIEIRRLGWTKDDGREFLKSRYGKRSRLHLTDEQLLEFLHYLESLPTNPG